MNPPHPSSDEIFRRLLDESSAVLASPQDSGIEIPDDELHREIIVPLLPAMLADAAIRGHWIEQHATGFVARIGRHFENGDPEPRWQPGDFEIHVTASYNAGPDARALADTLLSEEPMREMTASLMNQLLDAVWSLLAPARSATPAEPQPAIEIPAAETPAPEISVPTETLAVVEISTSFISPEPVPVLAPTAGKLETAWKKPSRALVRTLCRKLAASELRRSFAANSAPRDESAAVVARRISQRAKPPGKRKRIAGRTAFPG